jgi:single-strand selective monofunctional uracil DNA glycosylase
MTAAALVSAARALSKDLAKLRFAAPVDYVYDPLIYAWDVHAAYLKKYGEGKKKVVLLGMNPGPFGMAQTGVPFGEIAMVRDWLGVAGAVGKPEREHPQRPIEGFACPRSEVSGKRLWGLFKTRFTSAAAFAADHFVANYCPLVFMEESGKNFTPDQLPAGERAAVEALCDRHLRKVVEVLAPEWLVGIGGFAVKRAEVALAGLPVRVAQVPHPSPANPAANRDWAGAATRALIEQKVWTA